VGYVEWSPEGSIFRLAQFLDLSLDTPLSQSRHQGVSAYNQRRAQQGRKPGSGKARAIRFSTLVAICAALDCEPGDLLELDHEA